jgi:hypothetical protein
MYVVLFIFYGINFLITVAHVFTYFFASKKTWQLRDEDRNAKTGSWFWWLTVFRGLILLSAWMIWIWAVVKMYQMKLWMMGSGWITGINLQNDNQWTFGQILSVLLLSAAPITFLNAWTGVSCLFFLFSFLPLRSPSSPLTLTLKTLQTTLKHDENARSSSRKIGTHSEPPRNRVTALTRNC